MFRFFVMFCSTFCLLLISFRYFATSIFYFRCYVTSIFGVRNSVTSKFCLSIFFFSFFFLLYIAFDILPFWSLVFDVFWCIAFGILPRPLFAFGYFVLFIFYPFDVLLFPSIFRLYDFFAIRYHAYLICVSMFCNSIFFTFDILSH